MGVKMSARVHRALEDQNLQSALGRLVPLLTWIRQRAMDGVDFDTLSKEVHRVKQEAIDSLPHLVARFKAEAGKAGSIVYEARDARDANEYVLRLARERGVKTIVKSKSMLTEEIGLREYLEEAGITVTETDIGEWIVQLAGERPAHLVGPAIHKTIEQVAELVSRGSGEKLGPDPQSILGATRRTLRQAYVNADMGISGANIAVADTGTLVVVTNEGNGCMVTTLPPIYVAIVGCEKLVSTLEDANTIIRLLSRSTTGMKSSVYVSWISGPAFTSAISGTKVPGIGPSELHIVLVDNGRWRMRESSEFREALYCIKCGACLNVCPVFHSVAGQTYGHIYQGGIGAVLTAFQHGMDKAMESASLCMGCMACREVCPARIDIPRMILQLRARSVAERGLSMKASMIYRHILKHPWRLDRGLRLASLLQRPFTGRDSMTRWLPYPFNSLVRTINLPALSLHPFRDRMKEHSAPEDGGKTKVAFYAGCVADYAYPELDKAVMKVLRLHGVAPWFPRGQTCCGAPAFFGGDVDTAIILAERNITVLEEARPDYIVTVCPGCAVMLRREYPRLMAKNAEWSNRAEALSAKVRDFSELLLELAPSVEANLPRNRKVTYHDPCHLRRGLGIFDQPRRLLQREGFEVVEMADCDACCGFGGDVVLTYPELSRSVLKRKLDRIQASGADIVVTNCAPCILQLRGGLDKRKSPIKVMHTAELLDKHEDPLLPVL